MNLHSSPAEINACSPNGITRSHRRCEVVFRRLLRPILGNLWETAEEHYRHEERLMRAMHYSSFEWHKRQHNAARKKSKPLPRRTEGGDAAAAEELLTFLSVWLRDHMGVADRMMGAYLRNYLRFNTSLAS